MSDSPGHSPANHRMCQQRLAGTLQSLNQKNSQFCWNEGIDWRNQNGKNKKNGGNLGTPVQNWGSKVPRRISLVPTIILFPSGLAVFSTLLTRAIARSVERGSHALVPAE